jgi:hypothetical protein
LAFQVFFAAVKIEGEWQQSERPPTLKVPTKSVPGRDQALASFFSRDNSLNAIKIYSYPLYAIENLLIPSLLLDLIFHPFR